eukprot:15291313-Alexandrium_andersonii.AAC.1
MRESLRKLKVKARSCVKADVRARVDRIATAVQEAVGKGDWAAAYRHVRARMPAQPAPCPGLVDSAGALVCEREQIERRWADHWASLFRGQ